MTKQTAALLATFLAATTLARAQVPLPANYTTILDNRDALVMKVHYGPHEFVPMHDHTAYPTIYVYLNNSGVVDIKHEGPDAEVVHRPPTHAGTFRIAPGVSERHSVTNLSELPSNFLRIELKRVPPDGMQKMIRGPIPTTPPTLGTNIDFDDATLQIQRTTCADSPCTPLPSPQRSLVVVLTTGDTVWLATNQASTLRLPPGTQYLRIVLKYP